MAREPANLHHPTRYDPRDECRSCGEPLALHRRQYGVCVPCKQDEEARQRFYRRH